MLHRFNPFSAAGFAAMAATTLFTAGMASYTVNSVGNGSKIDVGAMLINGGVVTARGILLFMMGTPLRDVLPKGLAFEALNVFMTGSVAGQLGFVIDVSTITYGQQSFKRRNAF